MSGMAVVGATLNLRGNGLLFTRSMCQARSIEAGLHNYGYAEWCWDLAVGVWPL